MKKILYVLPLLLVLFGCKSPASTELQSLNVDKDEVKMIVNSTRDLNDIVTLRFEPKNIESRSVIWSATENPYFFLDGSTIKATHVGTSPVTVSYKNNPQLFATFNIRVYSPLFSSHVVSYSQNDDYEITGLYQEYIKDDKVDFKINLLNKEKMIKDVLINNKQLALSEDNSYHFVMPDEDVNIVVNLKDINDNYVSSYHVSYDLGTRETAKMLSDTSELENAFIQDEEGNGIINHVSQMEYIYGGGNGGRSDTRWFSGDMIKIGTTRVVGSFTMQLNTKVKGIIIKGYVSDTSAKVQVGDENSLVWNGGDDSLVTQVPCTTLSVASKETIENKTLGTLEINFTETSSVKISVINKKPLYIVSLQFIVAE